LGTGTIDLVKFQAMIKQKECLLIVGIEHPVDRKASTVPDHDRCFLDLLPHIEQVDNSLWQGLLGADYFQKWHYMSWTAENLELVN
jgi:hypothetical protein